MKNESRGYKAHLKFWALVGMLLEPEIKKIQQRKFKKLKAKK